MQTSQDLCWWAVSTGEQLDRDVLILSHLLERLFGILIWGRQKAAKPRSGYLDISDKPTRIKVPGRKPTEIQDSLAGRRPNIQVHRA
jgi:hypothetical protein